MYKEFGEYLTSLKMSHHTVRNYLSDLKIAEKNAIINSALTTVNLDGLLKLSISVSSKRRIRAAIRKYARFLVNKNKLSKFPEIINTFDLPKITKNVPQITRADEAKRLIKLTDDSEIKLVLLILSITGCRISSLVDLKIEDFSHKSIIFKTCKGGKFYTSIVTDRINELVDIVRNRRSRGYLFINKFGKKATPSSMRKRLQTNLGDNYVNPHSFRHGIATELIEHGVELTVLKDFMNHTSILTTEQYVHLADTYLKNKIQDKHPMLSDSSKNIL